MFTLVGNVGKTVSLINAEVTSIETVMPCFSLACFYVTLLNQFGVFILVPSL